MRGTAERESVSFRAKLSSSSLSFPLTRVHHISSTITSVNPDLGLVPFVSHSDSFSVSGSVSPSICDRSTVPYVACVTVSHRYTIICHRKARRAASPELARSPQLKRRSSRPVARRLVFRFVSCPPVASRVGNDRC
jgi:hypothetical protein